ncbi:hypothetical protein ACOMHN_050040 [Nucella lapillus]
MYIHSCNSFVRAPKSGLVYRSAIQEIKDVGCDGILGSGAAVDQCGVCGGNGSTCRVISGIFTRTRLRQHGYHHVTTIPAGACNVNITELARSRNYLALETSAGKNIVNGGKQLRAGGRYDGAGTTFDYRRRSGLWCPGACVFADGPLNESVTVQLLYYDRNPGIMYHFTVPQDTAKAVMSAANTTTHHHSHHHENHHHPHHPHPTANQRSTARRDEAVDEVSKHAGKRHRNRPRVSPHRRNKNRESREKLASLVDPSRAGYTTTTTTPSQKDSPREHLLHRPAHHGQHPEHGSVSRGSPGVLPREELSSSPGSGPRRASSSSSFSSSSSGREHSGQSGSEGGVESPFQPRPSALPNVASAPRYVPPEGGEGEEGAPIEYRHYYHVNSDHYRRHKQRTAALNSGAPWLNRNEARRRWQSRGDVVSNDVNAVGDVPLAVPASGYFEWTISGFSSCSRPCGGGVQQTTVVCVKSDTRVVVMAENCDVSTRPSRTSVECNSQPCDPQWTEADWSACSVTCGHGVQSRRVECKQRISPTLHLSVSADRCADPKPAVTQFCRQPPCFQWTVSNWTECSTHCGLGEQTRRARCVGGEGQEVAAALCGSSEGRPRLRVLCDMGSCAQGWYYSRWSRQCSPECGAKTYKTRQVHCASEDGAKLPEDKCPADRKPRKRKACGLPKPCGGKWFAGSWAQCNATCGEAWRTREVVCMKKHGRRLWGVVGKENCLRKERPPTRELCSNLLPCQPEWYMTHWSECSKPCGTGSKTREVKCLDHALQSSLTCPSKKRPHERRPCNKQSCDDNDNNTLGHPRHSNDYDQPPRKVAAPQRYQESTSPNTTFQRYHGNRTRQPMALQASAPARINLQQDVRSALSDGSEDSDNKDDGHDHHRRRHHSHHHHHNTPSTTTTPQLTTEPTPHPHHTTTPTIPTTPSPSVGEQQTTPPTTPLDPKCKDQSSGRWCLFVSQARLCGYSHYKKRCCDTCSKHSLDH